MARKRQLPVDDDDEIIVVQRAPKQRKQQISSIKQGVTKCLPIANSQQSRQVRTTRNRHVAEREQNTDQQKDSVRPERAGHTVTTRDTGKKASLKRGRAVEIESSSPISKRNRHEFLPSPAETPSKKAARLFDRLQLQGLKTPKEMGQNDYNTPPATPEKVEDDFPDMLPKELVELVAVYNAIVNAISAQLAANVSATRMNVKELLDMATFAWSKRDILLEDLRRVMAVDSHTEFAFMLEDLGKAGIFLVLSGAERVTVPDTARLRQNFERVLRTRWQQDGEDGTPPADFVKTLPLLEITLSDSVSAAEPMFSRGKQRLADLKASQAVAVEARNSNVKSTMQTSSETTINGRGSSLLDRILAKQAYNASMPAGPTKEQLQRKSALHRVEEIARTLEVLSAGRARASFSMQSIVQQLQQSQRNPMARAEVETCLKLMAEEIMPSFVSMISSGMVYGIVITRNGKLGIADLKKRLADAGI